jgi:hypothetical protein
VFFDKLKYPFQIRLNNTPLTPRAHDSQLYPIWIGEWIQNVLQEADLEDGEHILRFQNQILQCFK